MRPTPLTSGATPVRGHSLVAVDCIPTAASVNITTAFNPRNVRLRLPVAPADVGCNVAPARTSCRVSHREGTSYMKRSYMKDVVQGTQPSTEALQLIARSRRGDDGEEKPRPRRWARFSPSIIAECVPPWRPSWGQGVSGIWRSRIEAPTPPRRALRPRDRVQRFAAGRIDSLGREAARQ